MPHLISAAGQRYTVPDAGCVIGRGAPEPGEPLVLDVASLPGGRTVSRRHARLFRMGGHWWLRVEPDSHNPVMVGDRRLQPGESVPLGPHDALRLGDLQFTFDDPGAAGAAPTPAPPPRWAPAPPPPAASPTLAVAGTEPLLRVNPFAGLMIDEQVWEDAHAYHRRHAALHQVGAHGWGVLEGLEVLADPAAPGALVVRPGVAVDPLGRTIVLAQARRCVIEAASGTTVYVELRLEEVPSAPQQDWDHQQEFTRVLETAAIAAVSAPPAPPALELARLVVQDRVRNAVDPFAPEVGEIDLRYREALAVRRPPELLVVQGLLEAAPEAVAGAHQRGLRALLQELAATTALRPRWGGAVALAGAGPGAGLLYVATAGGLSPGSAEVAAMGRHLSGGGLLWVDCCAPEAAPGFAAAAADLAQRLGRSPAALRRGHPLATVRHVFGTMPGFAGGAPVLEDDGLVVSAGDLGCAWQGGPVAQPLDRAAIRTALEVGVNAAVYAHRRLRPYEALLLDG